MNHAKLVYKLLTFWTLQTHPNWGLYCSYVILYHWTALNRQVIILETVVDLTPWTFPNRSAAASIASIGSLPWPCIFSCIVHNRSIVVIFLPKTVIERCWSMPSNSAIWAGVRGSKHAVQFPLDDVNDGCAVAVDRWTSMLGLAFWTVVGVDACPDCPCCKTVPPQLPLLNYVPINIGIRCRI